MTVSLIGKVAVVTGAGQGLGRAYATALGRAGARVIVNDISEEVAEQAADGLRQLGVEARHVAAAVGGAEEADRIVAEAVRQFGRLDVMVTNAGVLRDRVLWKMTDEEFDLVIRVHLKGTFTCARAAVVRFREQGDGGRLILVGSPAGQRGNFGQTNYAAAKAGIAAMARTWAMECAASNVTVNAVIPVAATDMTKTVPGLAPFAEAAGRGEVIPTWLRRAAAFGTPEDVAGLVAFLASDEAGHITGQCIGIGGDKLSLWSHPTEIRAAFRDGGWDADAIHDAFGSAVGSPQETYGIPAVDFGGR